MTVNTLKYIEVMGATGAGIKKRSDVDKSHQTQFVTKWSTYLFVTPTQLKINLCKMVEIEGACPYFFEMRELIGQHPNNIPVGLGNNDTDIDVSAIIRSLPDYAPGNDLGGYASEEWDIERQTPECGNDSATNVSSVPSEDGKHVDGVRKRRGTENEKAPRKKKQKNDKFAEIVQAEEVTRQKEMDVAKVRAEKDIMRAKIKLVKIELECEKLCDQRE
ncbi:hypothetical protein BDR03DRAFT_977135 [Suillus americanus]|nr:hypothetical protein BDR03DRAFT_977135 [Suillus americanus]